jgi:hypothetical protein
MTSFGTADYGIEYNRGAMENATYDWLYATPFSTLEQCGRDQNFCDETRKKIGRFNFVYCKKRSGNSHLDTLHLLISH